MISLSWPRIRAILQKATTYNLKPTEESFPELPTVLVRCSFAGTKNGPVMCVVALPTRTVWCGIVVLKN